MPTVSTHVLDAAGGGARPGVAVTLAALDGEVVARGVTGGDGRIAPLGGPVEAGAYRLTWSTAGAFVAEVAVVVNLVEERHYHLPLLASPASAVSYLGA